MLQQDPERTMQYLKALGGSAMVFFVSAHLIGCVRYAAPINRTVDRGDLRLRLESISGARVGGVRVVYAVEQVPQGVTLLEATLNERRGNCGEGVNADYLGRSVASTRDAPLQSGERFTVAFPRDVKMTALTEASLELALLVRTPKGVLRCIHLPLTDGDGPLPLAPQQNITLGAEIGIAGVSNLEPVSVAVALPITAGAWLGSYHLNAGAGPVWAGCGEPACQAPSDEQRIRYGAAGLLGMIGLGRSILHAGAFGLDAVLRYRLMTLPADTIAGPELVVAHGPTVEPIVAVVMPPEEGVPDTGGSREALLGFGVPIGYVFADDGRGSVFWELDLRLFFTAF